MPGEGHGLPSAWHSSMKCVCAALFSVSADACQRATNSGSDAAWDISVIVPGSVVGGVEQMESGWGVLSGRSRYRGIQDNATVLSPTEARWGTL